MASTKFSGKLIYNKVAPTKKGGQYATGMVVMLDENGIEAKYNMVSFRSQVIKQFETVGEKGFGGKEADFWGEFKQNNWQGNITWQLHVEKLVVKGFEALAEAADENSTTLPTPPAGVLQNGDGSVYCEYAAPQPIVDTTIQPVATTPQPVQGGYVAPQPVATTPQPVQGGYIAPQPVQGGYVAPQQVQGGYIAPQPVAITQPVATVANQIHMQPAQVVQPKQVVQPEQTQINSTNIYDV